MANLPGDSVAIARAYMDSLLVESRVVGAGEVSSRITLCGAEFETPIMTAALSHLDLVSMAEGARMAGAACCIGMGENEELGAVLATGARVIKIIKPYADPEEIRSRIRYAEAHGALAVGMDVEHALNVADDAESVVAGHKMHLPSLEELRGWVSSTSLPFFVKGALSVRDAVRCAEIGCAGIILSHHNGLMRYAVPPVMILPEVRKAVGSSLVLVVDGGIASGFDAFKALALGADAVSVGRPLMEPLKEHGAEGVRDTLREMTGQLRAMMRRTDSPTVREIDPSVIRQA